ncbi:unnamed protein product [Hydatigera taeniaeformis]|uniref:Growth-regulating factor n=1 Tax=Hydatigena taeniaeformis TaxID=6205 RepID=A0A0R3WYI4_HYDTA|nr:unnamed protein product [Hydatigera taeniaeformis]
MTAEARGCLPSDSHSVALLQREPSRSGSGGEVQRLLKGVECSGDLTTLILNSSSVSTPTNTTSNQGCLKGHGLPLTAGVPYLTGVGGFQSSTQSGAYNMINSLPGFSTESPNGQLVQYDTQWNDSQLQNSAGSRTEALHEVPPYASSNVVSPEMNQSTWNSAIEVPMKMHLANQSNTLDKHSCPIRLMPSLASIPYIANGPFLLSYSLLVQVNLVFTKP